jgi:hypothetical protein
VALPFCLTLARRASHTPCALRPVIYMYPEQCHLDMRYRGEVPRNVLYIIGAGASLLLLFREPSPSLNVQLERQISLLVALKQ